VVGAILLLSGLAHRGVQAVAGGPWDGPVSWRKPTTFGLSFGLTVISVTWVTSFLRLSDRRRNALLGARSCWPAWSRSDWSACRRGGGSPHTSTSRAGSTRRSSMTLHRAGVRKLAHAVGLHGIVVLPGLAWLSGQRRGRMPSPASRRMTMRVGTAGYLGVLGCAVLVGAQGRLTPVAVMGLALARSVLVSAVAMATTGLLGRRATSRDVPAGPAE
jgi:hypothetical protein